jgi:hypothetical protein
MVLRVREGKGQRMLDNLVPREENLVEAEQIKSK